MTFNYDFFFHFFAFLHARPNFDRTYYCIHPSVRPSFHPSVPPSISHSVRPSVRLSISLSSINMLHRNFRTAYLIFLKFNIVISYNGQTICKPFSENQIKSFWVTKNVSETGMWGFLTCRAISQKRSIITTSNFTYFLVI